MNIFNIWEHRLVCVYKIWMTGVAVNTHCLMRLRGGWRAHVALWDIISAWPALYSFNSVHRQIQNNYRPVRGRADSGGQVCSAGECAGGKHRKINDEIISGTPVNSLSNQTGRVDLWPEVESYLRKTKACQKHFEYWISNTHEQQISPCLLCSRIFHFSKMLRYITG